MVEFNSGSDSVPKQKSEPISIFFFFLRFSFRGVGDGRGETTRSTVVGCGWTISVIINERVIEFAGGNRGGGRECSFKCLCVVAILLLIDFSGQWTEERGRMMFD